MRLGIDFETSTTVAVLAREAGPARPLLFDGSPLLPSAVHADPVGRLLVGRDAWHAMRAAPERFEPAELLHRRRRDSDARRKLRGGVRLRRGDLRRIRRTPHHVRIRGAVRTRTCQHRRPRRRRGVDRPDRRDVRHPGSRPVGRPDRPDGCGSARAAPDALGGCAHREGDAVPVAVDVRATSAVRHRRATGPRRPRRRGPAHRRADRRRHPRSDPRSRGHPRPHSPASSSSADPADCHWPPHSCTARSASPPPPPTNPNSSSRKAASKRRTSRDDLSARAHRC